MGIRETVSSSTAPIVFIANLLTEGDGMRDHSAATMTAILEEYLGRTITRIVVNTSIPEERLDDYARERKYPISLAGTEQNERFIRAPLWIDSKLARHDGRHLSFLVSNVLHSLTTRAAT